MPHRLAAAFRDRRDAGRQLAKHLREYAARPDLLVLGLVRGGVPVASEVARALAAPLDLLVVRKLGIPRHPQLAFGAVGPGGIRVLNEEVIRAFRVDDETVSVVAAQERGELERRERELRGDTGPVPVRGRTAILVDDGLATGASMRAAVLALRRQAAAAVVVAVPVGAPEVCGAFASEVDEIVCALTPDRMSAVGAWYEDFTQTADNEVRELLAGAT